MTDSCFWSDKMYCVTIKQRNNITYGSSFPSHKIVTVDQFCFKRCQICKAGCATRNLVEFITFGLNSRGVRSTFELQVSSQGRRLKLKKQKNVLYYNFFNIKNIFYSSFFLSTSDSRPTAVSLFPVAMIKRWNFGTSTIRNVVTLFTSTTDLCRTWNSILAVPVSASPVLIQPSKFGTSVWTNCCSIMMVSGNCRIQRFSYLSSLHEVTDFPKLCNFNTQSTPFNRDKLEVVDLSVLCEFTD